MNEMKELTPKQFLDFVLEFEKDLRSSVTDIMRDMENRLSFMTDKLERSRAIHSALMSMISIELSFLFTAYSTEHRERIMQGTFDRIIVSVETMDEEGIGL